MGSDLPHDSSNSVNLAAGYASVVPLVICGESGTGKTFLLSKAAFMVRQWISEEADDNLQGSNIIVVLRYLGTDHKYSSFACLYRSICLQLISCLDALPRRANFDKQAFQPSEDFQVKV
ncbi:unnamed protein product [Protopolystoma xenopodis]|uniref:Myosin motor domain-containing protein n=1 Tax=Protopolystoma xenopodis TaxID=117903 RepID=A0A448XK05_9PLAT|nr:unnamed protein product [Protopolystoma xenopodis]